MPKINFDAVCTPDPLPDGEYLCRIERVDQGRSKAGLERWTIRFVVQDPPFQGRIVLDSLTFSSAALPRIKLLCDSLGLSLSGEVELVPEMILGRSCRVRFETETYQGRRRSRVPFAGFAPANQESHHSGS